jgi:hypothetical protein
MAQTKLLIGLLGGVVLVGGGYFFLNTQKVAPVDEVVDISSSQTEETAQPTGKKMAFAEFMKQGGSYKCTVHQNVNDIETTGVTYMHNGMIRGEYGSDMQGMHIESHILVRDDYSYSWSSVMPTTGYKAKIVDVEAGAGADTSGTYSWNAEQIGDYDCQPWSAEASMFEVPKEVTFTQLN